jgi:predicted MFS family arabinose efflux permease
MLARLLWLSIGTFLIGAENFMIAGVLPEIAGDLRAPIGSAGQLVTVYALSYAISSPILATVLGNVPRKPLLIGAIALFALANAAAAVAPSLPALIAVRALMGVTAGVFTPTATAVAVQLVPPAMRGRAIATVIGGITVAVAFGAPLGALLASLLTWRAPFSAVAAVSALATIGLLIGIPGGLPKTVIPLSERLATAMRPPVLRGLLVTLVWSPATFVVFTYIAAILTGVGIAGWQLSVALLMFGIGGAAGNIYGGVIADRIGATRAVAGALAALAAAVAGLSVVAWTVPAATAGLILVALMLPWGVAAWAFFPAQSSRLIGVAPQAPVVVLSLNASALYFGQAAGAGLGSLAISLLPLRDLGFIGAALALAALAILSWSARPAAVAAPCPEPAE